MAYVPLGINMAISGESWPLDVGLSTRGSWVRILAKARRGIYEQDTLKSTALGNQNKQDC
jgi:hypothetical protein